VMADHGWWVVLPLLLWIPSSPYNCYPQITVGGGTTVIHSSRGDGGGYGRGSGYGRLWQSHSGPAPERQIDPNHTILTCMVELVWSVASTLILRPSTPPVFDHLPYAKAEGEGLGNFITWSMARLISQILDTTACSHWYPQLQGS